MPGRSRTSRRRSRRRPRRSIRTRSAPILVMRAFTYSTMTGLWGDIPFTEANKGSANFTPVYDTQQTIYDSLLTNLDGREHDDGPVSGNDFGAHDPVFAGDVTKWKKLANSLHARLGMNLSKVDAARAKAEVAAAFAAGGMTSNADNAQITGRATTSTTIRGMTTRRKGNGTRDDARFSVTFIDTLKHLSDPRLAVFAPSGAGSDVR